MAKVISRTLGEQQNTESQNQTPKESDTQWNPPGCGIVNAFSAKIDAVCDKNTERDEQLV